MDDLISRTWLLDVVENIIEWDTERDRNRIIHQIRELTPSAQQWIPVTEHTLPNHNSVVVVCGEKGTWDFGTYRGLASTNINFWNWKNNTVKKVHWWMYKEDALPMPWEGEADE